MSEECDTVKAVAQVKKRDHVWKHLVECLPKQLTPNHLSAFRGLLAVPIILLICFHNYKTAGGLFLFAAILDWLDGSFARIRNQVTKLGAFLDPAADKAVNFAAFLGFVYTLGSDYYLYLVIPIISVDLLLFFIATFKYALVRWPNELKFLHHKFEVLTSGANKWGKIKMVLQVIVLSFLMFFNTDTSGSIHDKYLFLPKHLTLLHIAFPLLLACLVFGVLSVKGHLQAIRRLP